METFDVIVVGSGSAGGALAGRLSDDPNRSVLVLEAGPVYRSPAAMPEELSSCTNVSASSPSNPHNWALPGELRSGLSYPYPRGKCLGGSSSINGCYFIRGIKADFDQWSALGNSRWAYDQVLPSYKRSETDADFANEYHGTDGPIYVRREPLDRAPGFTTPFTEACVELGFPEAPDKNAPASDGVGPVPMNVRDGRRIGTAFGYLIPAMARPNLRIVGNAPVQRVLFEGSRAVGVEAVVDGTVTEFRGGEVVVSAGALKSPQILMVSGVGPAEHLREHGIDVVHDAPGVGQNLMDHSIAATLWDSPHARNLPGRGAMTSLLNWKGTHSELEILPILPRGKDLLSAWDVLRRPIQAFKTMRGTSLKAITRQMRGLDYSVLCVSVLHSQSRGTVTLRSADPGAHPVLHWNLLSAPADRESFREALRVTFDLFQTRPMRKIGPGLVVLDQATVADDDALDQYAWNTIASGHPSGTCRMGPVADESAVVDDSLRVHGVDGLRVADTSIFPTMPSRGPNATAIMVGERLAELMTTAD